MMGNETSSSLKYGETLDNDVKLKWNRCVTSNIGSGREGHCACSIDNDLYLFGGITLSETDGNESNDLFLFNVDKEEWSLIRGTGDIPCARSAATISSVGNNLYLFGGLSGEVGWLNDLHKFDTDKKTWTKLSPDGNPPTPRDKLASVTISDKIYLFGGFGPKADFEEELETDSEDEDEGAPFGWFNDLFIYDTTSNSWSNPMQMNLGGPSPRAAHSMCAVKNHLIIFGGRDCETRRNDLHIFDTEQRKWVTDVEKLVSGRQPKPRSFHTATTIGHRIVIFGGRGIDDKHFQDIHIFDTKTKEWLQPEMEVPCARGTHTATHVGDKFVLFGGSSNFDAETRQCQEFHKDVYFINADGILSGSCTESQPALSTTQRTVSSSSEEPPVKKKKLDDD